MVTGETDATGREHHALLGVDVVHMSARDAGWADIVAAWNQRSGRADTFTHLPALDPIAASNWAMHDQCVRLAQRPS